MRHHVMCLTTILAASVASGCATVDMTDMAIPAASKTESVSEKNIVQRAAAKLYNAFTNRGFVAKSSGKRVQSAASILLNGLEDRDLTETDTDYAGQGLPASVVEADIRYASRQVRQTTKAAEVFLEMADTDRNMRNELESLEQALLASREASDAFTKSLGGNNASVLELKTEIAALTRVTDRFGDRVRLSAAAEMAARRAGEKS